MECFIREGVEYTRTRDINLRAQYIDNSALYLSQKKGISIEEAKRFIEWGLVNGKISYNDPMLTVYRKDESRDRYETTMKMSEYLREVTQRKLIMAPTLTCYLPASQLSCETSIYTDIQFGNRKKIKKEGHVAKSKGDLETATMKNEMQNKVKELINSISGTFTIGSTPLANRSGHSTLTSTCRTATAFANTNTERMLAGHRYFESGDSVLENIVTVLSHSDYDACERVINKYGFHLLSAQELFDRLKDSYHSYWRSQVWDERIMAYCEKLTPLERSIYIYTGDFFHLKLFNEAWVRQFVDEIHQHTEAEPLSFEESKQAIQDCDEFYSMFVAGILATTIGSQGIGSPEHESKAYYGQIGAAAIYIKQVFAKYDDYFKLFWRNDLLPANSASFSHAIRRNVLGGDTDSTLMHVLNWVIWYHGRSEVDDETKTISQLMIYMLCMIIKHSLAVTSGVMGVEEVNIFRLKMKNEFFFNALSPSDRTKHYVNHKGGCEGINYLEPELEVKGVALKNSKASPDVMDKFEALINDMLSSVSSGKKISMHDYITRVAEIEAGIFKSAMKGDIDYLPTRMIKVKEAYNIPMSSDYANYELWEKVFAPKYGHAPEPPYEGVRIQMKLPNPTAINAWLNSLNDQALAGRFRDFMESTGRKGISSIILPYDTIAQRGIPDELKMIINIRKIIYSSTEPFYIQLTMLGRYMINRWLSRMALDERMELLDEEDHKWFEGQAQVEMDKLRRDAKRHGGEQYETWDTYDEDEDDEVDEDGNLIKRHSAESEDEEENE